jgi:CRP-like cAMP-binding protein
MDILMRGGLALRLRYRERLEPRATQERNNDRFNREAEWTMGYENDLRGVSIFKDLSEEELARVGKLCSEKNFSADELIFIEHTEGDEMFLLLEGEVRISLEMANEDEAMPLVTLGSGEVFGELSVVDDSPRSATARAGTDCRCLVLKKEDFDRLIEEDHDLGFSVMRNVARLVSRRVRNTNQKILDNVSWGLL